MDYNKDGKPRRQRIGGGDNKRVYSSSSNSERRSYNSSERGEKRSYKSNSNGERRSFSNNSGERRGYGKPSAGSGERRSYNNGERKSYNNNGQRKGNFNKNRNFGSKPYTSRKKEDDTLINKMIDERNEVYMNSLSDDDNVEVPVKEVVRLNKFIANSGICSRREADSYIQAGVVTVNGEVVTELGSKVNIYTDEIKFNGEKLHGEKKVYLIMNKPKGYVTTASDPHADKTVLDLLKGCNARVFAVGRLDKNTTGVLMFTNDGEMAEKLTHPSYDKKKIYQVSLDSDLKKEDYEKILSGITLTDGDIAADDLQYVDDTDRRKIGIEIHSGKNRIVRRIFESLGYSVKALDRVYFAGLTKKGLKRGEWRYLTEGEVNILKIGSYR